MKKILFSMAGLALTAGLASAQELQYVKTISLNTQLPPAVGVVPSHIAVDNSGATPILYVVTLNDSGAVQPSVPALRIADPLSAAPAITTLDTNDATGGAVAGVDATRGYSGVAVSASGEVLVGWAGDGNDDSARLRKYNAAGTQVGEWVFTVATGGLNDRLGGLALSADGTRAAGARFFSTTTAKVGFYELVGPPLVRTVPTTDDPLGARNPRDIAFDAATGKIFINANGRIEVLTPNIGAAASLATPTEYAAATSDLTVLVDLPNNSFAGHGLGLSADGTFLAFTPSRAAGEQQRVVRVVNSSTGAALGVMGVADVKGTGSDHLLGRPHDVAIANIGGVNYYFVTDVDDAAVASRTFNRVVVFRDAVEAIDGVITPEEYGAGFQLAVQTVNTSFGNNTDASANVANGSELDSLSIRDTATELILGIAGNTERNGNLVNIFIDVDNNGSTGVNVIPANPFTWGVGATLPAGFGADIVITPNSGTGANPGSYVYTNVHTFNGTPTSDFVGSTGPVDTDAPIIGTITGNVVGVSRSFEVGLNNANLGGVIGGIDATAGTPAAVRTGLEIAIPRALLEAVGASASQANIKVIVAGSNGSGDFFSNQVLPPINPAADHLAGAPNFGTAGVVPVTYNYVNVGGSSVSDWQMFE